MGQPEDTARAPEGEAEAGAEEEGVIRMLPAPQDGRGRVETGAVQFGDDWPGLFIRGDEAANLAFMIDHLVSDSGDIYDQMTVATLRGLANKIRREVIL